MITVLHGDMLAMLPTLDAASFDACITDPPYGLGFMGKRWDCAENVAFKTETWREVYRVLKPGAHLAAFGGTRTFHRLAVAIEDAGFEIRDCLSWIYGSGFPKSLDVSKAIDKRAGHWRGRAGRITIPKQVAKGTEYERTDKGSPVVPEAAQWSGWGTALKPAHEPILCASKPVTVSQHFSMIAEEVTAIILEACAWSDVNVSDVVAPLTDIQVRSREAASSVLDGARMRSLESIGIAPSAARSSTFSALVSFDQIKTRGCSVLSHVRPNGSEVDPSGPTILSGEAGDILTRLMAMSTSVMVDGMSPNIVLSWQSISADLLSAASRFTIETATRLTTAFRTLNSSLLPNITDGIGGLRPSWEPIILARKPLEGTVVSNVLRHGTGALNIDACRIGTTTRTNASAARADRTGFSKGFVVGTETVQHDHGRFPANVLHDGSDEVEEAFAAFGESKSVSGGRSTGRKFGQEADNQSSKDRLRIGHNDAGSPSRFFFSAKADASDRVSRTITEVIVKWISESGLCQAVLQVDTGLSPERAIVGSASEENKEWSTFLSGNGIEVPCQRASIFITSTATSSTTASRTWSSSILSRINGCIRDARGMPPENGSSPVDSAGKHVLSLSFTLGETVSLPGANHALSGTPFSISVVERKHGHPTVKPTDLMRWLVRLLTPPGGHVLDPFAGTGSTGLAADQLGMKATLIEQDPTYAADMRLKIAADAGLFARIA